MNGRTVVVTGIGVVSAAGTDLSSFWTNLVEARSGIGPIALIPTDRLACRHAAEVRGFDPAAHFTPRQLGALDRFAQLTVVAAGAAMADSGLDLDREDRERIPVVIGSGVGGLHTLDDGFLALYGHQAPRLPPLTFRG